VVFGLDGRNVDQICSAIDAGYTVFDCADSYGDNINHLAEAMKKTGIKRENIEVVYKIDQTNPEDLATHINEVAAKLNGKYLDHVLIHNVENNERNKNYMEQLSQLKAEGIIKHIGLGNINGEIPDDWLKKSDSFEFDAQRILNNADSFAGKSSGRSCYRQTVFTQWTLPA
jgi:diketogulonate reductase-like aldo/keto reductase